MTVVVHMISVQTGRSFAVDERFYIALDKVGRRTMNYLDFDDDRIASLVEVGAIPYRERYQGRYTGWSHWSE